uniref:Paralemmin-1 n=1 Tax=Neogobius melanostomus TaxID=47308 RepID=A0A8C6UQ92_9GOBI
AFFFSRVIETDRINIIAEKRKWQTEMENKRRQLEDDKRALQHLKSKALRERWLLDGVPSGGSEHAEVTRRLQQDEEKARALEDTISRLERELVILESGGGPTVTPAPAVSAAHAEPSVLVHEMNGEDGGIVLSSFEVEELIHKADEASMKSETISNLQMEHDETKAGDAGGRAISSVEITGLEAKPEKEPSISEATEDNPVTMVFMGYQNVEDEDETKKVLGLKGTVKAELVVIEEAEGKTSPVEQKAAVKSVGKSTQEAASPTAENAPKEKEKSPERKNGETAASVVVEERAEETEDAEKKKKQPCKCCTIM